MIRIIMLYPLSIAYGIIVSIRNFLFDKKILPSKSFSTPIISIGNLCAGGSGKTPHTEYITTLLKNQYRVSILSRGYGRNTKGFIIATNTSTSEEIGDEPCQYINKFSNVLVAVGEKRIEAIDNLLANNLTDIILLDDAFQHRYVLPRLSILLTEYSHLFTDDYLLPSGLLREQKKNYKRAKIIIVTKCPQNLTEKQRELIIKKIKPQSNQHVYFTFINYLGLRDPKTNFITNNTTYNGLFLFAGIANLIPLKNYLKSVSTNFEFISFSDHHAYTKDDLLHIHKTYINFAPTEKLLVTTEKDFQRLKGFTSHDLLNELPIRIVEIEIDFLFNEKNKFNNQILSYVRKN